MKREILIIISCFILMISYVFTVAMQHDSSRPDVELKSNNIISPSAAYRHQEKPKAERFESGSTESIRLELTDAEADQLLQLKDQQAKWMRQHGYFTESELAAYHGYSADTLIQLGANGDLKALTVLGDKLVKANRRQEATQVYNVAAIYGSTYALRALSGLNLAAVRRGEVPEQDKLEAYKQMLISSEIAAIRGDRSGIWHDLQILNAHSVVLSSDDLANISNEAIDRYNALVQSRELANLEVFNNKENFLTTVQMNTTLPAIKNPNGWASRYLVVNEFDTSGIE